MFKNENTVIENFISFCDDMTITQEAVRRPRNRREFMIGDVNKANEKILKYRDELMKCIEEGDYIGRRKYEALIDKEYTIIKNSRPHNNSPYVTADALMLN